MTLHSVECDIWQYAACAAAWHWVSESRWGDGPGWMMNGPPPVHLATVNGHSAEAAPSAALVAHIYTRAGSLYYHGIALTQTVRRTRALMTSSLLGVMMMHGTVNNVLLYNHTTTSSTTQSSSCSPRHRHDVTIIYMLNRDISIQSVCGTAQFFSGCCVVLSTTPLVAYERFCCGPKLLLWPTILPAECIWRACIYHRREWYDRGGGDDSWLICIHGGNNNNDQWW